MGLKLLFRSIIHGIRDSLGFSIERSEVLINIFFWLIGIIVSIGYFYLMNKIAKPIIINFVNNIKFLINTRKEMGWHSAETEKVKEQTLANFLLILLFGSPLIIAVLTLIGILVPYL